MIPIPFLDLSRQTRALRPELEAAIASVIDSGRFGLGEHVEAFEDAWARYCGKRYCVAVASGTAALTMALEAVVRDNYRHVAVPALTFVATAEAVVRARREPVLIDCAADSFLMDAHTCVGELNVSLYGEPRVPTPPGGYRDTPLDHIDDACQAHGAPGACTGLVSCHSFYPSKNLGALGDAGSIVTDNAAIRDRARCSREHGMGADYVASQEPGWTARMDAIQAAVLLAKLPHLDGWIARRRHIAAHYAGRLAGLDWLTPPAMTPGHVWHLYVVRIGGGRTWRDRFREAMAAQGVETRIHYSTLVPHMPAYRTEGAWPNAERVVQEIVSLPLYPEMTDAEVDGVAEAARKVGGR